ncbi:MAG: GAF domain-containing SpoIIE family protein phosphatase [Vicinamibacteria bacterium]
MKESADGGLEHSVARLNSLLDVSRALAVELDLDPLLAVILEKATTILEADRSTIFLYDAHTQALTSHVSNEIAKGAVTVPLGVGISGHVARHLELLNIKDAYADPRFNPQFDRETGFRTGSILCAPLLSHKGELVGVIQLLNRSGGSVFGEDTEAMLTAFASVAGVAIDRARLVEAALEAQRAKESLRLAHDIQMSMLPRTFPTGGDLEISAVLTPAKSVGGDFYDVLKVGDRLWFAVGDTSGKGVGAALFTAMTLTLFRATARIARDPADALSRINRELARDNDSMMFVTVFAATLDLKTGRVESANAGHPPPYILRPAGVTALETTASAALGVIDDVTYALNEMTLGPSEGLVLFTDGVTEAQDPSGALWGDERLQALLEHRRMDSCVTLIERLVADVLAFEAGSPPSDDLTVMALRLGC